MPRKSVTTKSEVSDLIGAPADAGNLPPAPVAIEERPVNPLVVDERMIPDAGLPTDFVEGVLDIANEGSGLLRPQRFARATMTFIFLLPKSEGLTCGLEI